MAYPIKNTGIVQVNSIKAAQANFALGVNQGGYGLTSLTAFWNGKQPNVNGYVVYVGNGTSSPTMYVAVNDTQLITLSNNLGIGTNYNIEGALNAFRINGSTMVCINSEPLNIVTSGLTVYYDAAFTVSYPKAYASWFDLSGNDYSTSLVNTPTYSTNGGGSIIFDGTNQYADIYMPNALSYTTITICGFIKWLTFGSDMFLGMSLYDVWTAGNCLGYNNANGNVVGIDAATVTSLGLLGNWKHYTFVMNSSGLLSTNKIYINGVSVGTLTPVVGSDGAIPGFNTTLRLCDWLEGGYNSNLQFSNLMVYNRELTPSEILKNYYAGLQRFIPTNNLVLWLDGTNTNTRVITPTTAYDGSGNNYNGTFTNGTALAHRDGGTVFNFDGIDDRITASLSTLNTSSTWTIWINRTQSVSFYNMFMSMGLPYFSFRSDGVIQFSNSINGTQQNITFNPGLSNNVWYNFTFVSSLSAGNTTMIFYLNGVLQTQSTFAGQQATTTLSSFTLGDWTLASYPFKGKIGDVRLYSRALTLDEIQTIYTAGRPRYGL
jgi:hypothetical protein